MFGLLAVTGMWWIGLAALLLLALMPKMAAFVPGPPDAQLALQTEVTKTADFDGAWLDLGENFAPQNSIGAPVAGVVDVSAITVDPGGAISAWLEEDDDDGAGSPAGADRAIGAAATITATGIVIVKGFVTARFVRLSVAISGATSTMTYTGQLNPV